MEGTGRFGLLPRIQIVYEAAQFYTFMLAGVHLHNNDDRKDKLRSGNINVGSFFLLDDEFPRVSMQGNIQIRYD